MLGFILGTCLCLVVIGLTVGLLMAIYYAVKEKQLNYYDEVKRYKRN